MGQAVTSSQFYIYGRNHFRRTGYQNAAKSFVPGELENANLTGRNYIVTGANSGIGKEVSNYVASKGGTVYMVCRNLERAEAAKAEIVGNTKNDNVHVLIADCSLKSSVKAAFDRFLETQKLDPPRIHGVVCNAGALFNEKKETPEGFERTFALHLLVGTYYLTKLALPFLQEAAKNNEEPRVIMVSSGGMYNTKWPKWEYATGGGKFDGQFSYAYAKRGQVLLAEEWTKMYPEVTFVSSHPGWVDTPAVDDAYGDQKKWLEPMRTPWEGSDGIAWLTSAPKEKIESGAFYLDRLPQRKHLAGAFFTEGSRTKNTPEEVAEFMTKLEEAASAPLPEPSVDVKPKDTSADVEETVS